MNTSRRSVDTNSRSHRYTARLLWTQSSFLCLSTRSIKEDLCVFLRCHPSTFRYRREGHENRYQKCLLFQNHSQQISSDSVVIHPGLDGIRKSSSTVYRLREKRFACSMNPMASVCLARANSFDNMNKLSKPWKANKLRSPVESLCRIDKYA